MFMHKLSDKERGCGRGWPAWEQRLTGTDRRVHGRWVRAPVLAGQRAQTPSGADEFLRSKHAKVHCASCAGTDNARDTLKARKMLEAPRARSTLPLRTSSARGR